jgi:hypothetical protein
MKHSVYTEDHLLLNHKNCHVHRSLNISRVYFVNGHTSYLTGTDLTYCTICKGMSIDCDLYRVRTGTLQVLILPFVPYVRECP